MALCTFCTGYLFILMSRAEHKNEPKLLLNADFQVGFNHYGVSVRKESQRSILHAIKEKM